MLKAKEPNTFPYIVSMPELFYYTAKVSTLMYGTLQDSSVWNCKNGDSDILEMTGLLIFWVCLATPNQQ